MSNTRKMNELEELGREDAEHAYTKKGKHNLKEEPKPVKVNHCSSHTRFRVSCPNCVAAVRA